MARPIFKTQFSILLFAALILAFLFFGCTGNDGQPAKPAPISNLGGIQLASVKADLVMYLDMEKTDSSQGLYQFAANISGQSFEKSLSPIRLATGIDRRKISSLVSVFKNSDKTYRAIIIDGSFSVNENLPPMFSDSQSDYGGIKLYFFGQGQSQTALAILGSKTVVAGSPQAVKDTIDTYLGSKPFFSSARMAVFSKVQKGSFFALGSKPSPDGDLFPNSQFFALGAVQPNKGEDKITIVGFAQFEDEAAAARGYSHASSSVGQIRELSSLLGSNSQLNSILSTVEFEKDGAMVKVFASGTFDQFISAKEELGAKAIPGT